MLGALKQLDRLLRGEATRLTTLARGTIDVSATGLCGVVVVLGMLYGLCMASFAMIRTWGGELARDGMLQVVATVVKVPVLFLLTLAVTFPSLYVFNALVGSRLSVVSMLRLLVAAMAVMLAVLASFGTIVAFFSFTTTSYPFMLVLNVAVFAVSGSLGLVFLLQTLRRLTLVVEQPDVFAAAPPVPVVPAAATDGGVALGAPPLPPHLPGALEPLDGHVLGPNVRTIFRIWVVVFSLVGAQMAWVLRPFVGNPELHFTWFRARESNFFEGLARAITHLMTW